MTLTRNDIKLMASERLNDDPDGGGYMTGTTIQDNVENNLFPDISELDRAQGAVDYRKAFLYVAADNTDVYYGANVILDALAQDPAVSSVIVASESLSEVRQDLINRLNEEGTEAHFYGMKPLTLAGAVNDRVVQVSSLRAQFIPPSTAATPVDGAVSATQNNTRYCRPDPSPDGWLDESRYIVPNGHFFYTWLVRDGEGLAGGLNPPTFRQVDGLEFIQVGTEFVPFGGPGYYSYGSVVLDTFHGALRVEMGLTTQTATYTTGGSSARSYTLAHLPCTASETVTWISGGVTHTITNQGPGEFPPSEHATASVDRASGLLVVEFLSEPDNGSTVTIGYCRIDEAEAIPWPGSGSWPGASQVLSISTGFEMNEIQFEIDGQRCRVRKVDNVVREIDIDTSGPVPRLVEGTVRGSYDPATKTLYVVGSSLHGPMNWIGVATKIASSTATGDKVTATLPTRIEPTTLHITGLTSADAPFDLTPDVDGYFTGTATGRYVQDTGALDMDFTPNVKYATLEYAGAQLSATLASETISGVDPTNFSSDGRVLIFRQNDIAVVHNTQSLAPLTVSNGQTVSCGRDRIADARVFGNNGIEIVTGFTFSRAAGTVTFTNVSGYSQPVTIQHRVEDVSVILAADDSGAITLSRALTHVYPEDTSYISSALALGDMQARAHPGFQMATWTNIWANDLAGSGGAGITADYNEAAHPVIIKNLGGITERWLVQFTTNVNFKVIGEQVGQIAVGDTSNDCSPINPATGSPYFTIPALGWGAGWAIGNAYRFNTDGGSAPFWTVRCIAPSDPYDSQDKITVAGRGSINA